LSIEELQKNSGTPKIRSDITDNVAGKWSIGYILKKVSIYGEYGSNTP
jgi:hypothetical protein